jgi:hypothetical protein
MRWMSTKHRPAPGGQGVRAGRRRHTPSSKRNGIGCKISGRGTAAWWTQEYAVIRPRHRRARGVAPQNWHQTGTLVTLRAEEQRDETTQGLFHGMPTRLPHCGGRSMDPRRRRARRATRDPDPCPQIVRPYAKASEPRMERK